MEFLCNLTLREYSFEHEYALRKFFKEILVDEFDIKEAENGVEKEDLSVYGSGNNKLWIYFDENDNIIGTIGLIEQEDGKTLLKKFYVRKDYRSKKLGYELYKLAERYVIEKKYIEILLGTQQEKMLDAVKFYIRNGFESFMCDEWGYTWYRKVMVY